VVSRAFLVPPFFGLCRMQLAVNAQWPKELGGLGAQVLYIGRCPTSWCLPYCSMFCHTAVPLLPVDCPATLLHSVLLWGECTCGSGSTGAELASQCLRRCRERKVLATKWFGLNCGSSCHATQGWDKPYQSEAVGAACVQIRRGPS
jgi:hypothetical protein